MESHEYITEVEATILMLTRALCKSKDVTLTSPRPTYHPEVLDNKYGMDYVVVKRGGTFSMQVKVSTRKTIAIPHKDNQGVVEAGLVLPWRTAVKYSKMDVFPAYVLNVLVNQGYGVFYNGVEFQRLLKKQVEGAPKSDKINVNLHSLFPSKTNPYSDDVYLFKFDPLNVSKVTGDGKLKYTTSQQRENAIAKIVFNLPKLKSPNRSNGRWEELAY